MTEVQGPETGNEVCSPYSEALRAQTEVPNCDVVCAEKDVLGCVAVLEGQPDVCVESAPMLPSALSLAPVATSHTKVESKKTKYDQKSRTRVKWESNMGS